MRYGIKVTQQGKTVGYLAVFKDGETRIGGVAGYATMISVRDMSKIKDSDHIPFWSTRQQCYEVLSLLDDYFHDNHEVSVEIVG